MFQSKLLLSHSRTKVVSFRINFNQFSTGKLLTQESFIARNMWDYFILLKFKTMQRTSLQSCWKTYRLEYCNKPHMLEVKVEKAKEKLNFGSLILSRLSENQK